MTARTVLVAVALLVTAGCVATPVSENGTPTAEGANDSTLTLDEVTLPPGVTENGIANASRLVSATRTAMNESSAHRLRFEVESPSNGSADRWLSVVRGGERKHIVVQGPETDVDAWVEGDTVALRTEESDGPTYAHTELGAPGTDVFEQAEGVLVEGIATALLEAGSYEVVGATVRDGRRLVRLRATEPAGASPPDTGQVGFEESGNVTDLNVTVLVDERGLIHEMNGTVTSIQGEDGTTERVRIRLAVTDLGTATPSRPDWIDRHVPRLEASLADDGRTVRIEHAGGPPVPAGEWYLVGAPGYGRVTLDRSVEAGETLYLSMRESDRARVDGLRAAIGHEPTVDGPRVDLSDTSFLVETKSPSLSVTLVFDRDGTDQRASYRRTPSSPTDEVARPVVSR